VARHCTRVQLHSRTDCPRVQQHECAKVLRHRKRMQRTVQAAAECLDNSTSSWLQHKTAAPIVQLCLCGMRHEQSLPAVDQALSRCDKRYPWWVVNTCDALITHSAGCRTACPTAPACTVQCCTPACDGLWHPARNQYSKAKTHLLNPAASNAAVVCHPLSCKQVVGGPAAAQAQVAAMQGCGLPIWSC
jgi:hypothetical protein